MAAGWRVLLGSYDVLVHVCSVFNLEVFSLTFYSFTAARIHESESTFQFPLLIETTSCHWKRKKTIVLKRFHWIGEGLAGPAKKETTEDSSHYC